MSRRIYFDHAATSFPKAPGVASAMAAFLDHAAGNPGRGGHRLAVAATRAIEEARSEIAELLGAAPERTLLGPGATFWINTVLASRLRTGSRVVTSSLEHNAVMRLLDHLARTRGVIVESVRGDQPTGVPSPESVAALVDEAPTDLVVMTHASNVSGALLPVEEIARAVAPVPLLVDGAQSGGALPLDFESSGIAAFACSGHKSLLGPPGTGVLLLAPDFDVDPLVRGGTGSLSESTEMPRNFPDRLEAGTSNNVGFAGLAAAVKWLRERGVSRVFEGVRERSARLAAGLAAIPGLRLHGYDPASPSLGTFAITIDGRDNGVLADALDREHGMMLRVGLHCAPRAHQRLGTFPAGTLRAAIGPFITDDDVDALIDALAQEAKHE